MRPTLISRLANLACLLAVIAAFICATRADAKDYTTAKAAQATREGVADTFRAIYPMDADLFKPDGAHGSVYHTKKEGHDYQVWCGTLAMTNGKAIDFVFIFKDGRNTKAYWGDVTFQTDPARWHNYLCKGTYHLDY